MQQKKLNPIKKSILEAVLSSLSSLICYLDCEFNYLYVNEAYEKWFGISKEKCMQSNMVDIIGEDGFCKVRKYLELALLGKPQEFETEINYKYTNKKKNQCSVYSRYR